MSDKNKYDRLDGRFISLKTEQNNVQERLAEKDRGNLGDDAKANVGGEISEGRDEQLLALNREPERLPTKEDKAPWQDKLTPVVEDPLTSGVDPRPTDLTRRYIDVEEENVPEPQLPDRLQLGQQEQLLRPSGLFDPQDFKTKLVKKTRLIAVDSRDRDTSLFPQPTDFSLPLPDEIKNIQSLAINDIRFLNTLYTYSAARGNISIILQEEGRDPLTVTIREGAQSNIGSLLTELNNELNQDPLFDLIEKEEFFFRFQATGDYGLNFTYPKEPVFNEATGRFENLSPDDTKTLLVQKQFAVGDDQERLVFNTNETIVAQQQPVLKTAVEQGRLIVTEELSNRIFNEFQGVSDAIILDYVLSNSNFLDDVRYSNTYQFSLVNKYNVRVDANTKKIVFSAEKLADNLTLEYEIQREAYIAQREDQLGLSALTRDARNTLVKQELAVTIEFADLIRTQAAIRLGVPFLDQSFQDWANSNTVIVTSSNPASADYGITGGGTSNVVVSDDVANKIPISSPPVIQSNTIAFSNATAAHALVSDTGAILPFIDISFNLEANQVQVFDLSMAFGTHGLLFSVVPFSTTSPYLYDFSANLVSLSGFRKQGTTDELFSPELTVKTSVPSSSPELEFSNVTLDASGVFLLVLPESSGKILRLDTRFNEVSGDGGDVYLHSDAGRLAADMYFIQGQRADPRFQALKDTDASRNLTFDASGFVHPPRNGTNLRNLRLQNLKDAIPYRTTTFQHQNDGRVQLAIQNPDINQVSGTLSYRVQTVSDTFPTIQDISDIRVQEDANFDQHLGLLNHIAGVSGRVIAGAESSRGVSNVVASNWEFAWNNVNNQRPFTPLIRWTASVSGQYHITSTISEEFNSAWFAPPQINLYRDVEGQLADVLRTAQQLSGGYLDTLSGGLTFAPPSLTAMFCPENHPEANFADINYPQVRFADSARCQYVRVASNLDPIDTFLPQRRVQMITPDVEIGSLGKLDAQTSNIHSGGSNSQRRGILAFFDAQSTKEGTAQADNEVLPTRNIFDYSRNNMAILAESVASQEQGGVQQRWEFQSKIQALFNAAPANSTTFYITSPAQETLPGVFGAGSNFVQNDYQQAYLKGSTGDIAKVYGTVGQTTFQETADSSTTRVDAENPWFINYGAATIVGNTALGNTYVQTEAESLGLSSEALLETAAKNQPKTVVYIEAGETLYLAGMLPTDYIYVNKVLGETLGQAGGSNVELFATGFGGMAPVQTTDLYPRRQDFDVTQAARPSMADQFLSNLNFTLSCVYLGTDPFTIQENIGTEFDIEKYINVITSSGQVLTHLQPVPLNLSLETEDKTAALEVQAVVPDKSLRGVTADMETSPERQSYPLAVSLAHNLIIDDGRVYGWGHNHFGQLGVNPRLAAGSPNQSGIEYRSPFQRSFAATTTPNLEEQNALPFYLGINPYVKIQTATRGTNIEPSLEDIDLKRRGFQGVARVGSLSNIIKVSTSLYHSLAMDSNGAVYGWGTDSFLNTHDFNYGALRSVLVSEGQTANQTKTFADTISGVSGTLIRTPLGPSRLGTVNPLTPIDVPGSAKKWLNLHAIDYELQSKLSNANQTIKDPRLFSAEELAVGFLDPLNIQVNKSAFNFKDQWQPLPVGQVDTVSTISKEQYIWEATRRLEQSEPIQYRVPGLIQGARFFWNRAPADLVQEFPYTGNLLGVPYTGPEYAQEQESIDALSNIFDSNGIGYAVFTGRSVMPDNDLQALFGLQSNLSFNTTDMFDGGSNSNFTSLLYGVNRIANFYDNFMFSDLFYEFEEPGLEVNLPLGDLSTADITFYEPQPGDEAPSIEFLEAPDPQEGPSIDYGGEPRRRVIFGVPNEIRQGLNALTHDYMKARGTTYVRDIGLGQEHTPQGSLLYNANISIDTNTGVWNQYGENTYFTSNRTMWAVGQSNLLLSGTSFVTKTSHSAVDVAAGGDHTVIVLDDGSVVACGDPRYFGAVNTLNRYVFSNAFESNDAAGNPIFRDVSLANITTAQLESNYVDPGANRANTNVYVLCPHFSPAKRVECTAGATYILTTSGQVRVAGKAVENGLSGDWFNGACDLAVNSRLGASEFFVDIHTSTMSVVAVTNFNRSFAWGVNMMGGISGSWSAGDTPPTDSNFKAIRASNIKSDKNPTGRTGDQIQALIESQKTLDPLLITPSGADISFNKKFAYPQIDQQNELANTNGYRRLLSNVNSTSGPIAVAHNDISLNLSNYNYNQAKLYKLGIDFYPIGLDTLQSASNFGTTDQRTTLTSTSNSVLFAYYGDIWNLQPDSNLTVVQDLLSFSVQDGSDGTVSALPDSNEIGKYVVYASDARIRTLTDISESAHMTLDFNDLSWNLLSGPAAQVQQPEGLLGAFPGEMGIFQQFEQLSGQDVISPSGLQFEPGRTFTQRELYQSGVTLELSEAILGDFSGQSGLDQLKRADHIFVNPDETTTTPTAAQFNPRNARLVAVGQNVYSTTAIFSDKTIVTQPMQYSPASAKSNNNEGNEYVDQRRVEQAKGRSTQEYGAMLNMYMLPVYGTVRTDVGATDDKFGSNSALTYQPNTYFDTSLNSNRIGAFDTLVTDPVTPSGQLENFQFGESYYSNTTLAYYTALMGMGIIPANDEFPNVPNRGVVAFIEDTTEFLTSPSTRQFNYLGGSTRLHDSPISYSSSSNQRFHRVRDERDWKGTLQFLSNQAFFDLAVPTLSGGVNNIGNELLTVSQQHADLYSLFRFGTGLSGATFIDGGIERPIVWSQDPSLRPEGASSIEFRTVGSRLELGPFKVGAFRLNDTSGVKQDSWDSYQAANFTTFFNSQYSLILQLIDLSRTALRRSNLIDGQKKGDVGAIVSNVGNQYIPEIMSNLPYQNVEKSNLPLSISPDQEQYGPTTINYEFNFVTGVFDRFVNNTSLETRASEVGFPNVRQSGFITQGQKHSPTITSRSNLPYQQLFLSNVNSNTATEFLAFHTVQANLELGGGGTQAELDLIDKLQRATTYELSLYAEEEYRVDLLDRARLVQLDSWQSCNLAAIIPTVDSLQVQRFETAQVAEPETIGIQIDEDQEVIFNPGFTDTYMFAQSNNLTQGQDYLGTSLWGKEANAFLSNDLAGVGFQPQIGIDVSAGAYGRITVRSTQPTSSQRLKLRIVEGDATRTFGPISISNLIVDIENANLVSLGGNKTRSPLATEIGWRLMPLFMAQTIQKSTLESVGNCNTVLISNILVDTTAGNLSGYVGKQNPSTGTPFSWVIQDYPFHDIPQTSTPVTGVTISGITQLAYPLERTQYGLNIQSTDFLNTYGGTTFVDLSRFVVGSHVIEPYARFGKFFEQVGDSARVTLTSVPGANFYAVPFVQGYDNFLTPNNTLRYVLDSVRREFTELPVASLDALTSYIAELVEQEGLQSFTPAQLVNRASVEVVIQALARLINATYPAQLKSNILLQEPFRTEFASGDFTEIFKQYLKYLFAGQAGIFNVFFKRRYQDPFVLWLRRQTVTTPVQYYDSAIDTAVTLSGLRQNPYPLVTPASSNQAPVKSAFGPLSYTHYKVADTLVIETIEGGFSVLNNVAASRQAIEEGAQDPSNNLGASSFPVDTPLYPVREFLSGTQQVTNDSNSLYPIAGKYIALSGGTNVPLPESNIVNFGLSNMSFVFPAHKYEFLEVFFSGGGLTEYNIDFYSMQNSRGFLARGSGDPMTPGDLESVDLYQGVSGLRVDIFPSLRLLVVPIIEEGALSPFVQAELESISGGTSISIANANLNFTTGQTLLMSKSNWTSVNRVITQSNEQLPDFDPPYTSNRIFTHTLELDVHAKIDLCGGAFSNIRMEKAFITICGMQSNYLELSGTENITFDTTGLPSRLCVGAYTYSLQPRGMNVDLSGISGTEQKAVKLYDSNVDLSRAFYSSTNWSEDSNHGQHCPVYFHPSEFVLVKLNSLDPGWTSIADYQLIDSGQLLRVNVNDSGFGLMSKPDMEILLLLSGAEARFIETKGMVRDYMYESHLDTSVRVTAECVKDANDNRGLNGVIDGRNYFVTETFNSSNNLLLSGETTTFTSSLSNIRFVTDVCDATQYLSGGELSGSSNITNTFVNLSGLSLTTNYSNGPNAEHMFTKVNRSQLTVSGSVNYWEGTQRSTPLTFYPLGGVRIQRTRFNEDQQRNVEGQLVDDKTSRLVQSYPLQASFTPRTTLQGGKFVNQDTVPVYVVTYPTFTVLEDTGEYVFSQPTRITRDPNLLADMYETEQAELSGGRVFEWIQNSVDNCGGFLSRLTNSGEITDETLGIVAGPELVTLKKGTAAPLRIVPTLDLSTGVFSGGTIQGTSTVSLSNPVRVGTDVFLRNAYAEAAVLVGVDDLSMSTLSGTTLVGKGVADISYMQYDISDSERLVLSTMDLSQMGLLTATDPKYLWDVSHYRLSGGYVVNPDTFQNWVANFVFDWKQADVDCNVFTTGVLDTLVSLDLRTSNFPEVTDVEEAAARQYDNCGNRYVGTYGYRHPVLATAANCNLVAGSNLYRNQKAIRSNLIVSLNEVASNVLENLYGGNLMQSLRPGELTSQVVSLCGFIPLIDISAKTLIAPDQSGNSNAVLDISATMREIRYAPYLVPANTAQATEIQEAFTEFLSAVSIFVPKTSTVRFDPAYLEALTAFDADFSGTRIFGTELLGDTGFGGKAFTLDGFSNSQDAYVTQQNTWFTLQNSYEDIRQFTESNLQNQIVEKYDAVFTDVSGFASRERFADPIPFKINVIDSVNNSNLSRTFNWGLPQHLGFAKRDTDQAIRHISDNLFRLAEGEFVYINVNEELDTGTIDQAEGTTGIGGEIIGGRARYFAKLLLPTFGNIGTTLKQQQKDFDPIIRRLNKVNLRVLDKFGLQVDNDFCDFDMNIKVTQQDVDAA